MSGLAVSRFEVKIAGVRKAVKTSQGLSVPVREISSRAPDCVVVPAIGFKMPGPLETALTRPDVRDAAEALREWSRRGAMMTAACIGTFVMAESGLLDRQHATTTWWLAPLFRRRYPGVLLDESNMLVKSGMNVDVISTDWGSVVTRRANRNPPDQGGWNIFLTFFSSCWLGVLKPTLGIYEMALAMFRPVS